MNQIIDIFHATIAEADVERLLAVREVGVARLRERCPGLRRAELIRVDATTWVDLLTWEDAEAAEEAAKHFGDIPELHEMHEIVGTPTAYERGTIEHAA